MIKEAIVKIVDKQDLTYDEAYARFACFACSSIAKNL